MRGRVRTNMGLLLNIKRTILSFINNKFISSVEQGNFTMSKNGSTAYMQFNPYIYVEASPYYLYWPFPLANPDYSMQGISSISSPSELVVKFMSYPFASSVGLYNDIVAITGVSTTLPIKPFIKLVDLSSGSTINTFYFDYGAPVFPLISSYYDGYLYSSYLDSTNGIFLYKFDPSLNLVQKYSFPNDSYGNYSGVVYSSRGFAYITTSNYALFVDFDGKMYVNPNIAALVPSANTLTPIFYDGFKLYAISGDVGGDVYSNVDVIVANKDGSYSSYPVFDNAIIKLYNTIRVNDKLYYVLDKIDNTAAYLGSSLMYIDLLEDKNVDTFDLNARYKTNMCLTPDGKLLIHDYGNGIMYEYDTESNTMNNYSITTDNYVRVMICDSGHYAFILSSNAGTVKVYLYNTENHTIDGSKSLSASVSTLYPPMLIGKTLLVSTYSENF